MLGERMILLYISALVIFLYQTGRLRIVRRRRRVLVPFQMSSLFNKWHKFQLSIIRQEINQGQMEIKIF
ncbi:unnamed protein product [Rhizophagus irregularis]|nr:unnamed protein product [Rhizophagus irregularis]